MKTIILILFLLIIALILLGSILAFHNQPCCEEKKEPNPKSLIDFIKNALVYTAAILVLIKLYKSLESSGFIKRINQHEILAFSIGLTLIYFVHPTYLNFKLSISKKLNY